MKKKILSFIIKIIIFVIILIVALNIFTKYKPYNVLNALRSLQNIETANIDIKASKLYEKEDNTEQINFLYKFNLNKNFNNDIYNNAIATNGNIGIEVESLEMGVYAPIQTVSNKEDLDIFFSLDEVYSGLIGLEGDENIHIDFNSFIESIKYKQKYDDFKIVKDGLFKSLYEFAKEHKKDFVFLRNENQTILSGTIGRLSTIITEKQMTDLYTIIEKNIDKNLIDSYGIENLYNNLKNDLIGGNIYIDVYKNYVSEITIEAHTFNLHIGINNINNPVKIEIPKEEEFIEFKDYFDENIEDIFKLVGLNVTVEKNALDYFKDKFEDLTAYMTAAIDYSDKGNFDYANISLENIQSIIDEMKSKTFDESDNSLSLEDYGRWVKLFEELRNYTQLYKDSCEDTSINLESELLASVENMSKLLNELNIDISKNLTQPKSE